MQLGIVGLPNAGKSSLFNALTEAGAEIGSYPFTTIDKNIGVVPVPDERLDRVAAAAGSEETVPTTIEFVDIAGLVRGAHRGEGLGNQFLAHIREMDALVHVVRCFDAEGVAHVDGTVDPLRDIETIHVELALADLATVEKRMSALARLRKSGQKEYEEELETLQLVADQLDRGFPARLLPLSAHQQDRLYELHLLTMKRELYLLNLGEDVFREWAAAGDESSELQWLAGQSDSRLQALADYVSETGDDTVLVSARLEAELAELDEELRAEFLADLGLERPALHRLIRASYKLLDLITFFTANDNQCCARTLVRGTTAPEAAGKVHTDMQKGFIRAEVVPANDLIELGSYAAARERGLVRIEGRDYVVSDGDVMYFRFS